jgi:hypothetical protein
VFVADSCGDQVAANRASWNNLDGNLAALGLADVPVVIQYNKRDLPEAVAMATADRFGTKQTPATDRKLIEACAKQGDGVVETFFELVGCTWDFLDQDLKLADKLGIDSSAFRRALAEHVGVTEPGRIPR